MREQDADFFFGREQETAAALNLLGSPVNGVVTLIGNSGVGKSSLVEAGVFAALRRQVMPGGAPWPRALAESREWATITMRPGDDPIHALVAAFMELWFGDDMTDPDRVARRSRWAKLFRDGEGQVRDIIQATFDRFEKQLGLLAPRRILLNINQAEELYSLAPEAAREPFSKLIALALTDRRLAVIASIRSDYYGYHQANAPLFEHMHRVDVRPFGADGLKRVITGPAEKLGAAFESGELADFIVRGAAGQPGALPLLAFYMTDLWERMQRRGDGVLRLTDKTEMVDVGKALTAQADRFLAEHPADIDAVKRLFTLKLARVHEEGKAVRRRVARAKLDAAEWKLVEALSEPRWRLVTTGEDADGAYAEVAHEVLLQSWGTLATWLESEREFLSFKAHIEQAQAAWLKAERDKRALLSGLDLIKAEQWLATRERDFDADDAAFIRDSVAARDAELAAAARFRRRVQWGTFLVAVAMTGLSAFAFWQRHVADLREQETAEISADFLKTFMRKDQNAAMASTKPSLERGAADGNGKAMTYLGFLYERGIGVSQDYAMAIEWYQKGAANDDAQAMLYLGLLFENGLGVPKDYSKALEWYRKAADKGEEWAMRSIGQLYSNGVGVELDYAKAREWYEKSVASGDACGCAMTNLGWLYANGKGVPQDYAKAREWYEKAAAQNKDNEHAMANLGGLYAKGLGVPQDYAKAREWYEKAAANGSDSAMNSIGVLYDNGKGAPEDPTKAREWFEKAAAAGNDQAKTNLGLLYANGRGVSQDYAKAREWYEKAAAAGNDQAMLNLGVQYANGQGVSQDYIKAREFFEKAAEKGDTTALHYIGLLFENGYGVTQDYAKAREWYEKAAEKGDTTALRFIGVLYENGHGVAQDYAKAREWYEKAAEKGDTTALQFIGMLYEDGQGVAQDYAKAREWYGKAAEKGSAWAMTRLGLFHVNGQDVPQDYAKAREWWEKAAENGNADAMYYLGLLYFNGHGVPQDYSKAHEWYEKAAAEGNVDAMANLGSLYLNGQGVSKDYAKARDWYEKAASKDNVLSMAVLGEIYAKGVGGDRDFVRARHWYEKAAAGGNEDGKRALREFSASEAIYYSKEAKLQAEIAQKVEKDEIAQNGKAGSKTASALLTASWHQLIAKQFQAALASSGRAIALQPDAVIYATNYAHALMFLGQKQQALAVYRKYIGQQIAEGGGRWEEEILNDFAELEKAGLPHLPLMDEIRAAFSSAQKNK